MTGPHLRVLAHGGAENDPRHADGPQRAADAGLALLRKGSSALDAVVEAVRILEDDPRFNAGYGSNLRVDGFSVQMDAAVMDSAARSAGVIGLTDVRNPILVARDLLATPNRILAGAGATRFARRMGHAVFDPRTNAARERLDGAAAGLERGDRALPASREALHRAWNYRLAPVRADASRPASRSPSCDTVGAIAYDGRTFAAAGSTGGLIAVLDGRVSDIALPGCGLDASDGGAVCVTGAGDDIIQARVATRVLQLMERGTAPDQAVQEALRWLPPGRALAVLALTPSADAAVGRVPFPWARAAGEP